MLFFGYLIQVVGEVNITIFRCFILFDFCSFGMRVQEKLD